MLQGALDARFRIVRSGLALALIAWCVVRVAEIAPGWYGGRPPAYAGQYEARLWFSIQMIALLTAVLVGSGSRPHSAARRSLTWALLAVAAGAVVLYGRAS